MPKARTPLNRRTVVAGLAGAAASALAPGSLRAQGGGLAGGMLGRGISVLDRFGANIVVCTDTRGAIVVDSGAAGTASAVANAVRELAGSRGVRALFNTHWHPDQVGGNAAIAETGAEIIAHEKTRARLATPYYLPTEDRYQLPLPPAARPTTSFHESGSLETQRQTVRYGYLLEAHTDGDIYVHFEDDNVIVAGDAISPQRDPEFDWYGGGWLGGRIDSLEKLLAIGDDSTRFVPSYGPVVDGTYVRSEHELMLRLYDIMWERVRAGDSAADIHASGVLATVGRSFSDPMKLLYDLHKGMWAHYNTLSPDIV